MRELLLDALVSWPTSLLLLLLRGNLPLKLL